MGRHAHVCLRDRRGRLRRSARGGDFDHDTRPVPLSEIVERGCTQFRYDYDFGDDWQHTIDIETTLPAEKYVRYPRCVAGARACPPEDSGGPYDYDDLLDKLKDPGHKEHEEAVELIGDHFDPEKFNLDEVNEEFAYLRRWLGRRRGKCSPEAAFSKRDLVRVKPGVVHDDYPDIPLGGWVGHIKRIGWLIPIGYAVHWTKPTLDQAPPVYFNRCQRDEIKPYRHWLEEDQLEAAADETPVEMEQPTNLVAKLLSADDPDDRARMVFGLTSDDPLPAHNEPAQQRFLEYLKAHLSFPFQAEHSPASQTGSDTDEAISVVGLR